MNQFYTLMIQPELFGGYALVREWGRIGAGGQVRRDPFPTQDEAASALSRIWQAKVR